MRDAMLDQEHKRAPPQTLRGHPFFIEPRLAAVLFLGACILCASAHGLTNRKGQPQAPLLRVVL